MRENKMDYEDSLTTTQLTWMKDVQAEAFNAGVENTFIFTHAPIVGHGGDASSILTDNREDFVEWANDVSVRGVFAGHKHQHHIFYDVTVGEIDDPKDYNNNKNPDYVHYKELLTGPYTECTLYIESASLVF